jgi:hypothetical protein
LQAWKRRRRGCVGGVYRFGPSEKIRLIVDAQALDREQLDLGAGTDDCLGDAARCAVLNRADDRSFAAAEMAGGDDDRRSQNSSTVTCP